MKQSNNHLDARQTMRDPAIFQLADRTKGVARVGRLVGVQTALGKVALQWHISLVRRHANPDAKGFSFKTLENLAQQLRARLWQHDAALGCLSQCNSARL